MTRVSTPAEVARSLEDPLCREYWSVLTGKAILLIDLLGPQAPEAGIWRERITQLPAVIVGITDGQADGAMASAVDVQVSAAEPAELHVLEAAVKARPLASLALVQLLREPRARAVHEGLLAESRVYSLLQAGPEFSAWLEGRACRSTESDFSPAVVASREGEILQLQLNRPKRRNAFSAEMRDALCEGLALALSDESIRCVALSGAGPSFCSGGDLDEFGTLPDPATAHAIRATRSPARLLSECASRLSSRVHGACVGAGVELPAFGAQVIAKEDAFFRLPEVGMGLVPGAGGTVSLPRRIGPQRTVWMALTGARVDAQTALRWGLVDRIEPVSA